jgi:hypothetical protein
MHAVLPRPLSPGEREGEQHGNSVSAVEFLVALIYFHRDNREARVQRNVVLPTCTCCEAEWRCMRSNAGSVMQATAGPE